MVLVACMALGPGSLSDLISAIACSLREAPLRKIHPLLGHCPNSDQSSHPHPPPPQKTTRQKRDKNTKDTDKKRVGYCDVSLAMFLTNFFFVCVKIAY